MALNFPPDSGFSTQSEKSFYPSVGPVVDGYVIKNYGCYDGQSWSFFSFNGSLEGEPSGEMVKAELGDSDGPTSVLVDDVLDRLPIDPFGMNIKSTFTAISDWIQDFQWGFQSDYDVFKADETDQKIGDNQLFAGLNWDWKGDGDFLHQGENVKNNGVSFSGDFFDEYKNFDWLYDGSLVTDGNVGEFLSISRKDNLASSSEVEELQRHNKIDCDDDGGVPHDAMFFVLGYLGVQDLLSVEQVCRSLRDAVKGDPLLWRSIHIDPPLNVRISDDTLVKLTSRSQGNLQCLSLVSCAWITDSGLSRVLQDNPGLMKLSVPGCLKLTVEGILFNLRALKSSETLGIKHLRIGGLGDVTHQQFNELKDLLDADKYTEKSDQKPQFYRGLCSYLTCEDDRPIDIEVCPRCQKLRLVYDCPAESCQQKHQAAQLCRGCTFCIVRCIHCGRCINEDCEYQETFFLDVLCLSCWNQLLNGSEKPVEKEAAKCAFISQSTMYQFCLYG